MSIDIKQSRDYVLAPTLKQFDMWSESAERLLIGTMMQESGGAYIKQLGDGPALGLFQMEPATHRDIWQNYLKYRPTLIDDLLSACSSTSRDHWAIHGYPMDVELVYNLKYAILMARLHYRRVPKPLPKPSDIKGLGLYWKINYNTSKGKGTVSEYVHNFPYELYDLEREQ